MDICREQEPPFKDYGGGHYAACCLHEEGERELSRETRERRPD